MFKGVVNLDNLVAQKWFQNDKLIIGECSAVNVKVEIHGVVAVRLRYRQIHTANAGCMGCMVLGRITMTLQPCHVFRRE